MHADDQYLFAREVVFPPLPFDINLSLEHVFRFWEDKAAHGTPSEQIHAKAVLGAVAAFPDLRGQITDLDIVERHSHEIKTLLSAIFPDILDDSEAKSASLPFLPVLFNLSKKLKTIFSKAGPD